MRVQGSGLWDPRVSLSFLLLQFQTESLIECLCHLVDGLEYPAVPKIVSLSIQQNSDGVRGLFGDCPKLLSMRGPI